MFGNLEQWRTNFGNVTPGGSGFTSMSTTTEEPAENSPIIVYTKTVSASKSQNLGNLNSGVLQTQNMNGEAIISSIQTGETDQVMINNNGTLEWDYFTAPTVPIPISQGGTGAVTLGAALATLNIAESGINTNIESFTNLSVPLSVSQGGTGLSDPTPESVQLALSAAASGNCSNITTTTACDTVLGGVGGITDLTLTKTLGSASCGIAQMTMGAPVTVTSSQITTNSSILLTPGAATTSYTYILSQTNGSFVIKGTLTGPIYWACL